MFQQKEVFFWILCKTTITQSLNVLFSSARPLCRSLLQSNFPWKFCSSTGVLCLVMYQSTLLCQTDTKQGWQGKGSAYSACICVCVHTCVCFTGNKRLVLFPATDIRIIYPHVLNSLFPKLSGENKCLHLITRTSISISLKFGQKSPIVSTLFVPNFVILPLMGFAFQVGTEEKA